MISIEAMSVYTGVNVAGTIFSSLFAGRLIDSWFGYRASISLGALLVASGMGTIAATTIFEVTLVGGKSLVLLCLPETIDQSSSCQPFS